MLSLKGAQTVVYDPQAMDNGRRLFPTLTYAESALDACRGADVVLVATEWPEFVGLDPADVAEVTAGRVLLDGRNCMPRETWEAAGWTCVSLGRGRRLEPEPVPVRPVHRRRDAGPAGVGIADHGRRGLAHAIGAHHPDPGLGVDHAAGIRGGLAVGARVGEHV